MRANKMFSAFISSVYESLLDERSEVIDSLLDFRIFPICMEHFTATASNRFEDIKNFINQSDFFILLIGKHYGSCDEDSISWTQKEYEYAKEQGMVIIAIYTKEFLENRNLTEAEKCLLSDEEKNQLKFANTISFARNESNSLTISKIIGQFFGSYDFSKSCGWQRVIDNDSKKTVLPKALNIEGKWFHFHISDDDEKYLRTGYINISKENLSDPYSFKIEGRNFGIKYDGASGTFTENIMKRTHWHGDYMLKSTTLQGLFNAKREFIDEFNKISLSNDAPRRGIHDFFLDYDDPESSIEMFDGRFHDEAPSPKSGKIYVFKEKSARDKFLIDNFFERLEKNI